MREPSMYSAVISDSPASSTEIRCRLAASGSATKTRIGSHGACNNAGAFASGTSEKELTPCSPSYSSVRCLWFVKSYTIEEVNISKGLLSEQNGQKPVQSDKPPSLTYSNCAPPSWTYSVGNSHRSRYVSVFFYPAEIVVFPCSLRKTLFERVTVVHSRRRLSKAGPILPLASIQ
jgi:hypothetical protein